MPLAVAVEVELDDDVTDAITAAGATPIDRRRLLVATFDATPAGAQAAADREGQGRVDEREEERAVKLQASMDRGAASMERASDAAERNQPRAGGVG